jgi:2-oxoglutarate ferredoxin oxidoreductase subunit delta
LTKGTKPDSKELVILPERCKGCNFCTEFCPQHVLGVSTEINRKGYHPVYLTDSSKCTKCNICGMICPDFAISVVDTGRELPGKPGSASRRENPRREGGSGA